MKFNNLLITSVRSLSRNKMRSILTSTGIIIGISSVIMMVGLGNSARVAIRKKLIVEGINALSVKSLKKPLVENDYKNLKKLSFYVKYITPLYELDRKNVLIKYKNSYMKTDLNGVNNDYFKIKNRRLMTGRFFTRKDLITMAKVAIIGTTNKKVLFGNIDPLGKTIVINNIPFMIVGVLEHLGQSFSKRDFDNRLLIPYTTAKNRVLKSKSFKYILMSTHSEKLINETEKIVRKYFSRRHGFTEEKDDSTIIYTSRKKLENAKNISKALSILLAGIASIALFVGGVGIMNIMIVTVTERTREIGIRMAIGAKKSDILAQFLVESATLSTIGGIIGISMGLILYYIIISIADWPFIFSLKSVVISVVFATSIGIFFGFYPSKKAANLNPIDALKYE